MRFPHLRPAGGLTRVLTVAQGSLRRAVDEATGAKSPFIAAGIPDSVGSSAIALWREQQTLRASGRDVAVWPFDDFDACLRRWRCCAPRWTARCWRPRRSWTRTWRVGFWS
jgi:hypothetical protein